MKTGILRGLLNAFHENSDVSFTYSDKLYLVIRDFPSEPVSIGLDVPLIQLKPMVIKHADVREYSDKLGESPTTGKIIPSEESMVENPRSKFTPVEIANMVWIVRYVRRAEWDKHYDRFPTLRNPPAHFLEICKGNIYKNVKAIRPKWINENLRCVSYLKANLTAPTRSQIIRRVQLNATEKREAKYIALYTSVEDWPKWFHLFPGIKNPHQLFTRICFAQTYQNIQPMFSSRLGRAGVPRDGAFQEMEG